MNPVLHRVNKELRNLGEELLNYELYKEFYQFMKCSPMVQELVKKNRELKIKNKILKQKIKILESANNTYTYPDSSKIIHIKMDPVDPNNNVIDLTGIDSDMDDVPNIDYVLEENGEEEEAEVDDEEVEVDDDEVEVDKNLDDDEEEEEEVDEEEEEDDKNLDDDEEVDDDKNLDDDEEEDTPLEVEEEEVYEVKIKSKTYYVTNEKNGIIYSITNDGDVGDEIGHYVNGIPTFK